MHVRYGSALGLSVLEESTGEMIGAISGIVLHPDQLKVEGFFVHTDGFWGTEDLFLPATSILRWGTSVRITHAHHVAPISEMVRMQSILESGRSVLGQRIVNEEGMYQGICRDVQFSTKDFSLEWLFPKKRWRWRRPLPISAIVEVRPDAVVIREMQLLTEPTAATVLAGLDPVG